MYIGALYAAVQSIAVFKEHRDNGSELIVVSKPINRIKIVSTKFAAYISFCLFFGVVSSLFMLFVFCFSGVTSAQVFGLVFSVLITNSIFMLIFGFLGTFTSIFLNKIWTILINVIMVVLLVIYSTVCMATVKTPLQLAQSSKHAVISSEYLSRDNKPHSTVILTPN
ncbi:MAG: hypothetical protein LBV37_00300, partial [Mycoplasmataceae bacterium]|nr:hypothetical protein [Mycoplasmataceae bacterium]